MSTPPLSTTPMNNNDVIQQVHLLRHDIEDIQHSLRKVTGTLNTLAEHLPSTYTAELKELQSSWAGICKDFREIIWESKDVAGKARVAVADFNMFLDAAIKDTTISKEKMREDIANYRANISGDKVKSKHITDSLKILCKRVETFSLEWQRTVEGHKWSQYMPQFWKRRAELTELDNTLLQLKFKIIVMHCIFAAGAAALTVTVILSILHGCFDGSIVQGASGALSEGWRKIREEVDRRTREKKRRNRMREELDHESQNIGLEDIHKVATKLAAICSIWNSITADLGQVDNLIQNIDESNSPHLFQSRLRTIKESYSILERVFYEYQLALP